MLLQPDWARRKLGAPRGMASRIRMRRTAERSHSARTTISSDRVGHGRSARLPPGVDLSVGPTARGRPHYTVSASGPRPRRGSNRPRGRNPYSKPFWGTVSSTSSVTTDLGFAIWAKASAWVCFLLQDGLGRRIEEALFHNVGRGIEEHWSLLGWSLFDRRGTVTRHQAFPGGRQLQLHSGCFRRRRADVGRAVHQERDSRRDELTLSEMSARRRTEAMSKRKGKHASHRGTWTRKVIAAGMASGGLRKWRTSKFFKGSLSGERHTDWGERRRSGRSRSRSRSRPAQDLAHEPPHPWMLDPRTSRFIVKWDIAKLFILMYVAVVTPFEVAFLPIGHEGRLDPFDQAFPDEAVLFVINRLIDVLFTVDIAIHFFTMYEGWSVQKGTTGGR